MTEDSPQDWDPDAPAPLRAALESAGIRKVVRVPYRLSPVGAHTDHQGGVTLGFTTDRSLWFGYRANGDGGIQIRSLQQPDLDLNWTSDDLSGPYPPDWRRYPLGILRGLARRWGPGPGMTGVVSGELPAGGVSSSAALQIAVLLGALDLRGTSLEPAPAAELVRDAEGESTGVPVGLLDPTVILHGRPETFVHVDCGSGVVRRHRLSRHAGPVVWWVVDSGQERRLSESPYAERVATCRAAAAALGATGNPPRLSEISPETYRRARPGLDPRFVPVAEHYFGEIKRVKRFVDAAGRGDREAMGGLMNASADSLTDLFGCGTPETLALLGTLRRAPGVLGVNYSGAGFGGTVQVLAEPSAALAVQAAVESYRQAFPGTGSRARAIPVLMGPGPRVG